MKPGLLELAAPPFTLRLRHLPADGPARGACLLTHAMMANGAYLLRSLAPACAARGLEVFVLDFRGRGASGPRASRTVSWSFDDLVREDVALSVRAIRAAFPALPLSYAGHSLGGLVGLAFQATAPAPERLARVATICSSVWDLSRTRSRRQRLWRGLQLAFLEGLAVPLGRTALVRRARFGTDEESLPYLRQLGGWHRTGSFHSADGRVDYREALASIQAPVRLTFAEGDAWATAEDAARIRSWLPASAELVIEGRRSGLGFAPDHFALFTDRRARTALDGLAGWLAGEPSGASI